jgi:hypothetical protein
MIRLLRKAEMLKILMSCLYTSGFGILNISFLLLIGMFVMTVTGMRLFGNTKFGKHYNGNHNFRTIDRGLMLLFDVLLGKWNSTFSYFLYKLTLCLKYAGNWAGYSEDLSHGIDSPYCTNEFGTGKPYHNFAVSGSLNAFSDFVSDIMFCDFLR